MKKFKCDLCDMLFGYKVKLQSHFKMVHNEDATKPHKCDICSKCYETKSILNTHM